MATTIISDLRASGRPIVHYNVILTNQKRLTNSTMRYEFSVETWLDKSGSWLGVGIVLIGKIHISDATTTFTIKNSSEYWKGTSKHYSGKVVVECTSTSTSNQQVYFSVRRGDNYGEIVAGVINNATASGGGIPASQLLYTLATAPTDFWCDTIFFPYGTNETNPFSVNLSWTEAKPGINNQLIGYQIVTPGPQGVNVIADNIGIDTHEYQLNITDSNSSYLTYGIGAVSSINVNSTNTSYSTSQVVLARNNPPGAPNITVNASIVPYDENNPSVTVHYDLNSVDIDRKQNITYYYEDNGSFQQCNASFDHTFNNVVRGNSYGLNFKAYDGYDYSSIVSSPNITINQVPVITLNYTDTPVMANGLSSTNPPYVADTVNFIANISATSPIVTYQWSYGTVVDGNYQYTDIENNTNQLTNFTPPLAPNTTYKIRLTVTDALNDSSTLDFDKTFLTYKAMPALTGIETTNYDENGDYPGTRGSVLYDNIYIHWDNLLEPINSDYGYHNLETLNFLIGNQIKASYEPYSGGHFITSILYENLLQYPSGIYFTNNENQQLMFGLELVDDTGKSTITRIPGYISSIEPLEIDDFKREIVPQWSTDAQVGISQLEYHPYLPYEQGYLTFNCVKPIDIDDCGYTVYLQLVDNDNKKDIGDPMVIPNQEVEQTLVLEKSKETIAALFEAYKGLSGGAKLNQDFEVVANIYLVSNFGVRSQVLSKKFYVMFVEAPYFGTEANPADIDVTIKLINTIQKVDLSSELPDKAHIVNTGDTIQLSFNRPIDPNNNLKCYELYICRSPEQEKSPIEWKLNSQSYDLWNTFDVEGRWMKDRNKPYEHYKEVDGETIEIAPISIASIENNTYSIEIPLPQYYQMQYLWFALVAIDDNNNYSEPIYNTQNIVASRVVHPTIVLDQINLIEQTVNNETVRKISGSFYVPDLGDNNNAKYNNFMRTGYPSNYLANNATISVFAQVQYSTNITFDNIDPLDIHTITIPADTPYDVEKIATISTLQKSNSPNNKITFEIDPPQKYQNTNYYVRLQVFVPVSTAAGLITPTDEEEMPNSSSWLGIRGDSNILVYYGQNPTVAYRKNMIGINTDNFSNDDKTNATVIISNVNEKHFVYLRGISDPTNATPREATIDLNTGELDQFIISGGTWTAT